MHISLLTEDALILLFCKFSLQEQILLRAVCTQWRSIIEQLCRRKRHLKLFGPNRDADFYQTWVCRFNLETHPDFTLENLKQNSIVVYGQRRVTSRFLTNLFPDLEQLLIYTDSNRLQIDLPFLLGKWQTSLTSLAMFRLECFIFDDIHQIWNRISSLHQLERLHLFETYKVIVPADTILQSTLARLDQFSLGDYRSGDIVPVLAELGPQIEHLRLGPLIPCSLNQLQKLLTLNPGLSKNLRQLSLSYIQPHRSSCQGSVINAKQLIRAICINFTNLTYLDIKFSDSIQLTDLILDLTYLTKLTELKLDLGLIYNTDKSYPKLQSIKTLHLDICELLNYDTLLESLLPELFPGIEVIHFKCYSADLATVKESIIPAMQRAIFRNIKQYHFVTINNHYI